MEHRICRLCEESDDTDRMIKYATRSYAHWGCFLKRKSLEDGLAWIKALYSHEIHRVPVLIFQGWLDQRGWAGDRGMEILLRAATAAELREASR